jgi:hypothetical protein
MPRILIVVSGGLVQSVHTDSAMEVLVFDEDNLKDGLAVSVADRNAIYDQATHGLAEVGFATLEPADEAGDE